MMFLYILVAIVALVILLILFASRTYDVKRSIVIKRPLPQVYEYLKYIKNQDYWSPWKKMDPGMRQEFLGTDGTVGFVSKWDSAHKNVGAGEQEITGLSENEKVATQIRFLRPFKSQSDAYLLTDKVREGTKVTWGFSGKHNVPLNVMMLAYNMDKAVGKDFEQGLNDLKQVLES